MTMLSNDDISLRELELTQALEKARHALVTLSGLWATDQIDTQSPTPHWQIDESKTIAAIDAVL